MSATLVESVRSPTRERRLLLCTVWLNPVGNCKLSGSRPLGLTSFSGQIPLGMVCFLAQDPLDLPAFLAEGHCHCLDRLQCDSACLGRFLERASFSACPSGGNLG